MLVLWDKKTHMEDSLIAWQYFQVSRGTWSSKFFTVWMFYGSTLCKLIYTNKKGCDESTYQTYLCVQYWSAVV